MSKRSGRSGRPNPRLLAPTLTVWIYDSALGAAAGEVRLSYLRKRKALHVHEAITVSWMPGAHQPRIGHLRRETSAGAARDSVLGGLAGLIFLAPPTETTTGARISFLAQKLHPTGIDRVFLEAVQSELQPDTSALLVLSSDADLEEVRPVIERGLARGDVALMRAQLPDEGLGVLRDTVRELRGSSGIG